MGIFDFFKSKKNNTENNDVLPSNMFKCDICGRKLGVTCRHHTNVCSTCATASSANAKFTCGKCGKKLPVSQRSHSNICVVCAGTNYEKQPIESNEGAIYKYGRKIYQKRKKQNREIVLKELYMPSHAGEFEYGFSLVYSENRWQLELSYIAAKENTETGFSYYDLPDDIWNKPPYEALYSFASKVAKIDCYYIRDRKSCKDYLKLERLFEDKQQKEYSITATNSKMIDFLKDKQYDIKLSENIMSVVKHSDDPWNHFNEFIATPDGIYNYAEVQMGGYDKKKRVSCKDFKTACYLLLSMYVVREHNQEDGQLIAEIKRGSEIVINNSSDYWNGQFIIDELISVSK